jgi:hypothetical protein
MITRRQDWSWNVRLFGRLALAALVAGGASIGAPRGADASIMIALDLSNLVQQADHIAVVEVGSVTAAWDEKHERIYSTIQLKVIERWKGTGGDAAAESLTVVQPGGTVGDLRMTVFGMSTFVPGERSLVFLRGPAQHAQVVGMTQGKRSMRYESAARTWMVAPADLRHAKLVRPPPGHSIAPTALSSAPASAQSAPPVATTPGRDLAVRDLPVDDIRNEIKRLIGAARP